MSEQAVVEDSNTTSDDVVSDDNALDNLLNEYDEGTKEETPTGEQSDISEVVSYIKEKREQENKVSADAAISNAVKSLKGDSTLPDAVFRGMIYEKSNDARFLKAFTERESNPDGWNKVIGAMSNEFKSSLPKEDGQLSADKEALASAVQSASTHQAQPQEVDLASMSDAEFLAYKAKLRRG